MRFLEFIENKIQVSLMLVLCRQRLKPCGCALRLRSRGRDTIRCYYTPIYPYTIHSCVCTICISPLVCSKSKY